MKIRCKHGYFFFEEQRVGEVSDFISLFGLNLVAKDNYFTFEELEDAPDYAIKSTLYLNLLATKTFAGNPWEVMEANNWVYNYDTGLLALATSITSITQLDVAGNYIVSPGLILPGSLTSTGSRILNYFAYFSKDTMRFRYTEVSYA